MNLNTCQTHANPRMYANPEENRGRYREVYPRKMRISAIHFYSVIPAPKAFGINSGRNPGIYLNFHVYYSNVDPRLRNDDAEII